MKEEVRVIGIIPEESIKGKLHFSEVE